MASADIMAEHEKSLATKAMSGDKPQPKPANRNILVSVFYLYIL